MPPPLFALAGVLLGSLLGLIPGMHLAWPAGLAAAGAAARPDILPPEGLAFLVLGMAPGHVFASALPAICLGAPDESAIGLAAPGQALMRSGRGLEAATLAAAGSLGGIAILAAGAPFAPQVLPRLHSLLQEHLRWIAALLAVFCLMNVSADSPPEGLAWRGFLNSAGRAAAGALALALSGLLGIGLAGGGDFARLALPCLAALFAVPEMASRLGPARTPARQPVEARAEAGPGLFLQAVVAGAAGGALPALFPHLGGAAGGWIGQALTARDDAPARLVAHGAARAVYLAGAYLIYLMPGLHRTEFGPAAQASRLFEAYTPAAYLAAAGSAALCGALAFCLQPSLARIALRLARTGPGRLAAISLASLAAAAGAFTGWQGLAVMSAAAGIGLTLRLGRARSICGLGLVLVPVMLGLV